MITQVIRFNLEQLITYPMLSSMTSFQSEYSGWSLSRNLSQDWPPSPDQSHQEDQVMLYSGDFEQGEKGILADVAVAVVVWNVE
jgi:hypothetical protein